MRRDTSVAIPEMELDEGSLIEAKADVFLMQNQFDQPLGCVRVKDGMSATIHYDPRASWSAMPLCTDRAQSLLALFGSR